MKHLPWVTSTALAAALIGTVFFFQSKLSAKEAEVSDLKLQLQELETDANKKLQAANQQLASLAEEANNKIKAANMPEVDVRVRFRAAFLSSGNVAMITNTGARAGDFTIEVERPDTDKRQTFDVVLDPNATKEIGQQEGWAFISGDKITVKQPNHKTLTFAQP